VRLLDKHEICAVAGVTYPVVWKWMRAGRFPRSRIVGGRSMWLSDEVEQWLRNLPLRPLKGDALVETASRSAAAAAVPRSSPLDSRSANQKQLESNKEGARPV
jgi:predicted DNA-binding transcriptional regulator AlpA